MVIVLAALLAAAGGGPQLTDAEVEKRYTPAFKACMATGDAAQGVTVAMHDCLSAEYARQDRVLNATYRAAMQRLPTPAAKVGLRALQRRWIAARERLCASQAEEQQGGSIVPLIIDGCFTAEAIRRTAFLRAYR